MAEFKINGEPVNTIGELPKVGEKAPDFVLTKTDMSDVSLKDFSGKKIILNIFPSVDTPVCSASVRRFNSEISKYPDAVVLSASLDLPFAHKRFCETEGLEDVIPVTELRDRSFGEAYGVRIAEGPLKGLLARSVIVINKEGKVIYSRLVEELKTEPDYEDVLKVMNRDDAGGSDDIGVCTHAASSEHSRISDIDEPCDDGRAGA